MHHVHDPSAFLQCPSQFPHSPPGGQGHLVFTAVERLHVLHRAELSDALLWLQQGRRAFFSVLGANRKLTVQLRDN